MDNFKKFCENDDEDFVTGPRYGADYYDRYAAGLNKDPADPHRSRRVTKQQREEIMNLAKQGMNAQEIAFHVDVPSWVINGLLKRHKLGGKLDPNLTTANLQRQGDEEEMMADRAKWDHPVDVDEDPEMAKQVNLTYLNRMKIELMLRYYMGDSPQYQQLVAHGDTKQLEGMVEKLKKSTRGTVNANHVELSIDKLIRNHIKQLNDKPMMQKVMNIIRSVGQPFKAVYNNILQTLTTSTPQGGPIKTPTDYQDYQHSRELSKPVTNPYVNIGKQQPSMWQRLKNRFGGEQG